MNLGPAVLVATLALQAQQPPMFSPAYGEALRASQDLNKSDIPKLNLELTQNPEDQSTRLKLLAYYHRTRDAARIPLVLWLIEHHPDSELLHSGFTRLLPMDLSATNEQHAIRLWQQAPNNATTCWNAAFFFETLNPELHRHYLERTVAADPNHPFALRPLAHLYAEGLLAGKPQPALDASKNVWILGNAANRLHPHNPQLAERYFLRAKVINPKLDRNAILPPIRPATPAQALDFDAALKSIKYLPIAAFPAVPPTIASVLTQRRCTNPQPYGARAPRNLIRGEFFAAGEAGWAALCSVNHVTTLLAFRNNSDLHPVAVNSGQDRNYLQGMGGTEIGYSHEIATVDGQYIMRHYRAYGGPQPPPITHHGIDDSINDKASVTLYFHQGKWLRLQGAD